MIVAFLVVASPGFIPPAVGRTCGEPCSIAKAVATVDVPKDLMTFQPSTAMIKAQADYVHCYMDKLHDYTLAADDSDELLDRLFEAAYRRCGRSRATVDALTNQSLRQRYPLKSEIELRALTALFRGFFVVDSIDKSFGQSGFGARFNRYMNGVSPPTGTNASN